MPASCTVSGLSVNEQGENLDSAKNVPRSSRDKHYQDQTELNQQTQQVQVQGQQQHALDPKVNGKVRHHCDICGQVFTRLDQRNHHAQACASALCKTDHQHNVLHERFTTLKEAKDWVKLRELDQHFVIADTKTKNSNSVTYGCIQSTKCNMKKGLKTDRTRKTENCNAFIFISTHTVCSCIKADRNETSKCRTYTKGFILRACVRHSHELDPGSARLSAITKLKIATLLKDGVSPANVIKFHFNKKEDTGSKQDLVTLQDIHRIYRSHGLSGINPKKSELENTLDLLHRKEVIGFNLRPVFPNANLDHELREKEIDAPGEIIIAWASPEQRQWFRNNPAKLEVDSTHMAVSTGYTTMTIVIPGILF